jgi:hypothetical protein
MNNTAIKIVQLITYLLRYVPFEIREGVQKIFHTFDNRPITNKDSKIIKDAFIKMGIEPFKSGELGIPEDLAQFKFLFLYADFNEDCSAFQPIARDGSFSVNDPLYEEAKALYRKRHYKGSDEYYADIQAKQDALNYEVKYLTNHISLPKDCYFKGHGDVDVTLFYGSFDSYIKVHYIRDDGEHGSQFDGLTIMPEMRKHPFIYHYTQLFDYTFYAHSLEERKYKLENDYFKVLDKYNWKHLYHAFKEPILQNVLQRRSPELTQFVEDYFNDRLAS